MSTLLGYGLEWLCSLGGALPAVARFAGGGCLALAVFLAGWALRDFARTDQRPEPWTPSPTLLVRGPYRFTRNPLYLALSLGQIGVGLVVSSVGVLLFVPVSMVFVYLLVIRFEEAYLDRRFGEAYRTYCASTRRWL